MAQQASSSPDVLMTPLPPPRVNRTSSTSSATALSSPPTTTSVQQLDEAPSLPIQSPRRQVTFAQHTHSLLDDCSDEEENEENYVNDDDEEEDEPSSSYVMVHHQRQNSGAWKKRHRRQSSNNSSMVASNNIQIALLQTKHRRWEIQSSLCGSHAQSNQIFDLSARVHYIPKFHNRQQQNFSFSPIRPSSSGTGFDVDDDNDDEGIALLARLSVPIESIRAAALASGLWRTVRLVKLPRGLFGWHWLMWKEQRMVPDSVYFGDNMPLDNEVWSLLQMLGDTFPNLQQIDFGGDIAKSHTTTTAETAGEDHSVDLSNLYNKDEWRDEILTCIMQCLPRLIAVDGFAVEVDRADEEKVVEPVKSNDTTQASSNDGSFDDVPLNVNEERHSTKPRTEGQAHTRANGANKVYRRSSSIGSSHSFTLTNQCDVATEPSDALEDVSENMMSLFDNYMHSNAHGSEERPIPTDQYGPMIESPSEEEVKPTTSSSLASSFSWGSTGSSKPPTCPSSSDTRRRLPTKPTTKSKIKSKLSKKNKRRLKKLT
jgi:hypothetical protein